MQVNHRANVVLESSQCTFDIHGKANPCSNEGQGKGYQDSFSVSRTKDTSGIYLFIVEVSLPLLCI